EVVERERLPVRVGQAKCRRDGAERKHLRSSHHHVDKLAARDERAQIEDASRGRSIGDVARVLGSSEALQRDRVRAQNGSSTGFEPIFRWQVPRRTDRPPPLGTLSSRSNRGSTVGEGARQTRYLTSRTVATYLVHEPRSTGL